MDLGANGSHSRVTAHQFVRDTIRRAIVTGKISTGTRLVQSELAKQLDVSTTPVREALRDLAGEGFIDLDAHRGAVVRTLSSEELEEMSDLRQLLEPLVLERAIPFITELELARAGEILSQAEAETSPASWVELNREFHQVFIDAARSPRLGAFLSNLQDTGTMYIVASLEKEGDDRRIRANEQHRALLDAATTGDVERAKAVMSEHVRQTSDSVAGLLHS